jgi:hypothetical protein
LANLVVKAVFIAYFGRPAAFAISAARWSGVDLAVEPIDLDYAPPLTVLVACHNEEAWSDRWSPPEPARARPPHAQRAKIAALGLADAFDVIVISDEIGRQFRKPHPVPVVTQCDRHHPLAGHPLGSLERIEY